MKKITVLLFMLIIMAISSSSSIAEVTSEITQRYANGIAKEVTFYEHNKMIAHKLFDENGVAKEVVGNIPDGFVSRYYSDGKLELLVQYKNNKINGKQIEYYENGNLKVSYNLKDNLFEGHQNAYYDENGKLQSITSFVAGKKNGVIKVFDNGILQLEGNLKNGTPEGLNKMFYPNGQIKYESNYKEGKLDGILRTFYTDGHLQREMYFNDGALDGYARNYDNEGNLLKEEYYEKGKKIKSTTKNKADNAPRKSLKSVIGGNRHIDILSHRATSAAGIPVIVGEAQNNTGRYATAIEISVTYYDENGDVLGTDSDFFAHLDTKDKAPFQIVNLNEIKYDHYKLRATILF
ncbi:MAG: toxin-antitoxin system YwqK family antitoxin [Candidatus Margulisbacteria bacterium]|nr:toxin-antitoxin system YwqK family antitoxin [Candidatus Margulisiibacteriota bacterium]MBU1022181.1 toxin-antitoxin system YwqK family antitoxin [Candidatus Margulisiibacteriota bacterium]MBU1729380.1 toxin-antitoxin system YwqK family antitoxin [Candidatus Margulisiibacteriota bacterium]MBU1955653.1 toxin-antitoxin system YwqK family antitoxin [Candidatus Margulisiibacteriota bacterium]